MRLYAALAPGAPAATRAPVCTRFGSWSPCTNHVYLAPLVHDDRVTMFDSEHSRAARPDLASTRLFLLIRNLMAGGAGA
jgi:hypothetical protein